MSNNQEIKTAEVILWDVYIPRPYVKQKNIVFVIPIENNDNGSITCKYVRIVNEGKKQSLVIERMNYSPEYWFIPIDMQTNKDWLRVKELEKERKQKRLQDEQEPKKKRGRPKKEVS